MAARDSRRGPSGHFRRLAKAGIIDPQAFARKRDGNLTKASERRIEKIWDRVGGLIANPEARPFHTYKPRAQKQFRLARAAGASGISRDFGRIKGVRGIPIAIPKGVKVERVRFDKRVGFGLRMARGALIRSFRFVPFQKGRLIKNPREYARQLNARFAAAGAVRIRTGAGFYNPEEHGQTLGAALVALAESYDDSDEWLAGLEVVEFVEF